MFPRLCKNVKHLIKTKAVFDVNLLWNTGSTLDVQFINNPIIWNDWQKAWIAHVVTNTVMVYANINFIFHISNSTLPTNKNCEIRISCDSSDGSYSYIGKESADISIISSMNFGWMDAPLNHTFTYNGVSYQTPLFFDQGGYSGIGATIVHEFGHALGMLHELQTPFGNPFRWNTNELYSYFSDPNGNNWTREQVDINIVNLINVTSNGSNFDRNSIMKYSLPSRFLINPTTNEIQDIQQINERLSDCDKYWLQRNYPGRNIVTNCNLDNNKIDVESKPINLFLIIFMFVFICIILFVLYNIMNKKDEKGEKY